MSSDQSPSDPSRSSVGLPPAEAPEVEFSAILVRMIQSMRDEPAQFRDAIYELARIKLQREAWQRNPPVDILEMRRLMLALETAIEQVEAVSAREDELRRLLIPIRSLWAPALDHQEHETRPPEAPWAEPARASATALTVIDHAPADPFPDLAEFAKQLPQLTMPRASMPRSMVPLVRVAAVIALLAGGYAGLHAYLTARQPGASSPGGTTVAVQTAPAPVQVATAGPVQMPSSVSTSTKGARLSATASTPTQPSEFPLPTAFGVYAVSGGELRELDALPGRVPDPRVAMSTPITVPSRTVLPDDRPLFVLYRRDLATDAPDRVTVRVVAKVVNAMSFDTGRARTTRMGEAWTIRSNAYEMRVAPLSDHPDMLVIRPKDADFTLPPGRYALVVKGEGFDFTVPGEVTHPTQCLELVQAGNGDFYAPCRRPRS